MKKSPEKNLSFDAARVRADFLQLAETKIHGKDLVYLDNAATTLKPLSVVEAIAAYYQYESANIHRGIHFLSEAGTARYENVREQVKGFINAASTDEIIFTGGTTASLNLVAKTFGEATLKKGDEVLISTMEHHSNIVPWQMLCEKTGALLKIIPINDAGEILIPEYEKHLSAKTKIVSVTFVSNTLGTINPVKDMIRAAHKVGAVVVVDAAQAVAHLKTDVQDLDCDFLAFSAHKIFGPTGVGVLYGKKKLLEAMPPFLGGGDMIDVVTFEKTTYNDLPHKFEAGTPHIAGVIGLGAALDYVNDVGLENIAVHEHALLARATEAIQKIAGVSLVGTAKNKSAILSFVVEGKHALDIGTLLDLEGVAVRTGHHCTQPLLARLGLTSTVRASFSVYNNFDDVEQFVASLQKVINLM